MYDQGTLAAVRSLQSGTKVPKITFEGPSRTLAPVPSLKIASHKTPFLVGRLFSVCGALSLEQGEGEKGIVSPPGVELGSRTNPLQGSKW